jgi:hypothetical protein
MSSPLTIAQANRRMRMLRWGSRIAFAIGSVMLLLALLKGLYSMASAQTQGPFAFLWLPIVRLVANLYGAAEAYAPRLTKLLWSTAPNLDMHLPLWAGTSIGFWLAYALVLAAGYMRGAANRWARELAEHRKRIQQLVWEQEAIRQLGMGAEPADVVRTLEMRITLKTPPPPWHGTLAGMIVLGIALPVIVELVKILLGLAKLP